MARARISPKGNVKLTLTQAEARFLRDVLSNIAGAPHILNMIDAMDSIGISYRRPQCVSGTLTYSNVD